MDDEPFVERDDNYVIEHCTTAAMIMAVINAISSTQTTTYNSSTFAALIQHVSPYLYPFSIEYHIITGRFIHSIHRCLK